MSSVRSGTEHWTRLDFENKNVKVAGNLVANTDTVTHQVKKGNDLQERKKHRHSLQAGKQELHTHWTHRTSRSFNLLNQTSDSMFHSLDFLSQSHNLTLSSYFWFLRMTFTLWWHILTLCIIICVS